MVLLESEVMELEQSCGSLAAAFSKKGSLRFKLGAAHKGWVAEDMQALMTGLSAVLAGEQKTANAVFLRRPVCMFPTCGSASEFRTLSSTDLEFILGKREDAERERERDR